VSGDELRIGSFPTVWDNTTPEKRPTSPGLLVFRRVVGWARFRAWWREVDPSWLPGRVRWQGPRRRPASAPG